MARIKQSTPTRIMLAKCSAKKPNQKLNNSTSRTAAVKSAGTAPATRATGKTSTGGAKKKRRYRPSKVALKEIRKYQSSTNLLLPKASFKNLVKEITQDYASNVRWKAEAVEALQEASEQFIVGLFEDSQHQADHAKRATVMLQDWRSVMRLRGVNDKLWGSWATNGS